MMNTEDKLPDHLLELGHSLNRAMQADLAAEQPSRSRHRHARWLRNPRRAAIGAVATAVAIPATAFAATQLITTHQVAASIPQGTLALAGTHPTCTVVKAGVEYHCVLTSAPSNGSASGTTQVQLTRVLDKLGGVNSTATAASAKGAPVIVYYGHEHRTIYTKSGVRVLIRPVGTRVQALNWKGTTEVTVDAAKHVNGGCRSLNTKGTEWQCYLGQAAVRQQIITAGFLGQYAPTPSVG